MCDRTGSQDSYGTGILGKEIIPQYSNLVFLPYNFYSADCSNNKFHVHQCQAQIDIHLNDDSMMFN